MGQETRRQTGRKHLRLTVVGTGYRLAINMTVTLGHNRYGNRMRTKLTTVRGAAGRCRRFLRKVTVSRVTE